MNNTLRYALAMVFAGVSMPMVFGQEEESTTPMTEETHEQSMPVMSNSASFPDTPENHWAYEAINKLKDHGVLLGYPDGLFRGSRVPTRYEMAYLVNAAYTKLMSAHDGLNGQIKALEDKINGMGNVAADVKALRDQLDSVQKTLDGMKTYGDDIANLKKMGEAFKEELSKMGVDVEAMKKDISTLEARVTKLESRRHTVEFSGDANILVLGGFSSKGSRPGLNIDGRLVGTNNDENGNVGRDLSVYHEVALTMSGVVNSGPKWRATLVAGNMLSNSGEVSALGNQSYGAGLSAFGEAPMDLYIQDLGLTFDAKLGGIHMDAELGRFGYQISDHLLKRMSNNWTIESNPRWNSANHMFDGGLLKFKLSNSGAQLHLFGGRNSESATATNALSSNWGVGISPIAFGNNLMDARFDVIGSNPLNDAELVAQQTYGARVYIPFGKMGEANLAGMLFQTNKADISTATGVNGVTVYGGDVKFNVTNHISVKGAYGKSILTAAGKSVLNDKNDYMHGSLGFDNGRFGVTGGYRHIKDNYIAPGAWDTLGWWTAPTGVKGFVGDVYFQATPKLRLSGFGRVEDSSEVLGAVRPRYTTFGGEVKYALNDRFDLGLSGQRIQIDQKVVDKAEFTWITLKAGYRCGNALFNTGVQFSDLKNTATNYPGVSTELGDKSRGGQAFVHAIYKF